MKNFLLLAILALSTATVHAQANINDLLAAGLNDAERFTTAYLNPVTEGTIYGISGSWYNSGKAKPFLGFEISAIGNFSYFKNKEDKKAFTMNIADYESLRFQDGASSKEVSTALGDISGVNVVIEDENGLFSESFELPSGLASENINFIPSGYIQASMGLIKGTELKARFLPKINTDDVSITMYGFGIQHDFTEHLPADKIIPVAISAVIGYTYLNGVYDFTGTNFIQGENQRIDATFKTWNFEAVVSTRLPIINFYGGLGYITGNSTVDVLGTYRVTSGPFTSQTYTDPFSIDNEASGMVARVGTKLKLGFFRIHADYTLSEFNTLSAGINFGFR